jgi:hypothetical protein
MLNGHRRLHLYHVVLNSIGNVSTKIETFHILSNFLFGQPQTIEFLKLNSKKY